MLTQRSERLGGLGYPLLFDVKADPSETYSMATKYPDVMKAMLARVQRAKAAFAPLRSAVTSQ
jgi:arylsulfatase A